MNQLAELLPDVEYETESCLWIRGFLVQLPHLFKTLVLKGYTPIGLRNRREAACVSLYLLEEPFVIEAPNVRELSSVAAALQIWLHEEIPVLWKSVVYGDSAVSFVGRNEVDPTWSIRTARVRLDGRTYNARITDLCHDRSKYVQQTERKIQALQVKSSAGKNEPEHESVGDDVV